MKPFPAHLVEPLVDMACAIQQVPAPTFHEERRARVILELYQSRGIQAEIDSAGNVIARLPGGPGHPLVLSAHLDTVHPSEKYLPLARTPERLTGPGIGDNSLGLAALLMLADHVQTMDAPLPGNLWLVSNTCEEGLGNLRGMRAVVECFASIPYGYIVIEGMGQGGIVHRGLGSERFKVTVKTPGGHSWEDYGTPSAVHILSRIISSISDLEVPSEPRSALNVGVVAGGTSINTIAPEAHCLVDVRSADHAALMHLAGQVRLIVKGVQPIPDVQVLLEVIGQRPSGGIPSSHPLVRAARQALEEVNVKNITLDISSTDANIPLAAGYPAVCIGITTGGCVHTENEYLDIPPILAGMRQITSLLTRLWS